MGTFFSSPNFRSWEIGGGRRGRVFGGGGNGSSFSSARSGVFPVLVVPPACILGGSLDFRSLVFVGGWDGVILFVNACHHSWALIFFVFPSSSSIKFRSDEYATITIINSLKSHGLLVIVSSMERKDCSV